MNEDRREDQTGMTEPENTGLGKWFWLSAVIAACAVAALVFVLISPGKRGDENNTAGPSSAGAGGQSSAPADTQDDSWGDKGCNGTSGDSKTPTTPPSGVTWKPQGSMSYPTSSDLGPKKTSGNVRTCFQHSPSGALLAAANVLVGAASGPQDAKAVMQQQFTTGPGKQSMIAGLNDPENQAGTASPAGFQLGACSPQRCIVNMFISGGEGAATYTMPMVWNGGDWKLDGQLELKPAIVQGLPGGWAQWAAS